MFGFSSVGVSARLECSGTLLGQCYRTLEVKRNQKCVNPLLRRTVRDGDFICQAP